ncbi:MAG: type II secretion system protein GspD [Chlamydiia bacterium]|nr:type II secretion system protein GspD [Chlamydiia bacterium]
MSYKKLFLVLAFVGLSCPYLGGQTIAEKKASLSEIPGDLDKDSEKLLAEVNKDLQQDQDALKALYRKAWVLYQNGASEKEFEELLGKIQEVKENIELLQNNWREFSSQGDYQEPYALWHQPDTTLGQLVMDYGSEDYVYLIPKEIGQIPLSIGSNLPIPRAAWSSMLEEILSQNGIGIRQLNPFLRELYSLKSDKSAIRLITNKRSDLNALAPNTRIAYVLSPEPSEVRRTYFFLDNFVNRENSIVQLVGRDILLIAEVQEIQDLLKLSDFVGQNRGDITWRAVSLSRISPDEMTKILSAIFNPTIEKDSAFPIQGIKKTPPIPQDGNGLKVIKLAPPATGLFLVGTSDEVKRAESVIRDVESQVGGAKERIIHWHTAKYSDPEELADVLYRIYNLMVQTGAGVPKGSPQDIIDQANQFAQQDNQNRNNTNVVVEDTPRLGEMFPPDTYFDGAMPINPAPVVPANSRDFTPPSNRSNFIVDQKTSSIVMVVEADILPSLKDLIKRLDVPKKMVQIEVLLFEKRVTNVNEFGLNLLRMGSCASNSHKTCALFNDPIGNSARGIFDFIMSREKTSAFPAFDMIYRFLLSQEGVTINSNPSVVTVNQTPAFIAIQEEQSIDTGTFQLEEANVVALRSFRRAQYGTTIKITPTIHTRGEKEPYDSITLESDITFDTVRNNENDRPNVIRRNIKNEARVADGETIILGGLRRKDTEDFKDSIPFVGEIPGLGKLFSLNRLNDTSTEMFIFITPRIVHDPACDLEWIRQEEMCRRPGDLPEFMCSLIQAQEAEKERLFEHTLNMLLGRRDDRLYSPGWHNDDTCSFPTGEYEGR